MHQTEDSFNSKGSPRHKSERYPQAFALKSIQKGIRQNDVSLILGQYNMGSQAPIRFDDPLYNEEKEVHQNLGVMKRDFDKLKLDSLKLEKEMAQYKDKIAKLKIEEESLTKHKEKISLDHLHFEKELERAKERFEENLMNEKSYKHVLKRLKHDNLCFKLKLNQVSDQLEKKRLEYNHANVKQHQSIQYNLQTKKIFDEMMKNIEQENKNREQQLQTFKQQITNKKIADQKREERIAQQMEIAEHALHDKDANEKKWRKLLLTHKFLQSLLKNKIENEMKKFDVVEHAYKKIKTATGITEAQEIVQKFLSKEQTYGQLLGTIAESEKKIEHLKRKNENMKVKFQQLKDEVQVMEMSTNKTSKKGLDADIYKSLYGVDDKAKKAEIMSEKLFQWTIKTINKFDKLEKKPESERLNYYEMFPRDKDKELFEHFSQKIFKELSTCKDEEVAIYLAELDRGSIKQEVNQEDYKERNIRVKFKKPTVKQYLREKKSRDSKSDISLTNRSLSQFIQSEQSSAEQSYNESDSEGNQTYYVDQSLDEAQEIDFFTNLREEQKRAKKRRDQASMEVSKKLENEIK